MQGPALAATGHQHVDSASASYGIHDVGAPGSQYEYFSQVTGFNNTGQFVGEGYQQTTIGNKGAYWQCIAYTGKAGAAPGAGGDAELLHVVGNLRRERSGCIHDRRPVEHSDRWAAALNETLGWIYNPKTKVATSLGTIPGYSCQNWQPVWVNGPGRVLGYTYGCSPAADFFWTWDSKHGMVQVNNFPGYHVVQVTINDEGQIAVDLYLPNFGPHRWGYPEPPSSF